MSFCVECNSIFQKVFLMWHLGAKQFKCHTYRSLLADNINYNDNLLQLNNRKRFNFGNVIIKLEHVIFEKKNIYLCNQIPSKQQKNVQKTKNVRASVRK